MKRTLTALCVLACTGLLLAACGGSVTGPDADDTSPRLCCSPTDPDPDPDGG